MAIGLRRLLPLAGALVVGLGVTAASAQDAVTTGAVNMRAGPGTQYERITTLPAGAPVDIADCTGSWCRVVYRGVTGYVARSLLDEDGGVVEAPPRVYVEPPPVYVEPPYFYGSPGYYAPYRPGFRPPYRPGRPDWRPPTRPGRPDFGQPGRPGPGPGWGGGGGR
ncbi:MAG: SH3 domain-containing protein, partial [Phreatobacter sp.]|uniref:SH3 domain-containing protein n=1 Tax=Phreatobacter sp. TaxID=1966341 RepID=UPI004036719D